MKHQSIAAEHDGAGTDSRDTPRVRHLSLCFPRDRRQCLADTRVTGWRLFAKPTPEGGQPFDPLCGVLLAAAHSAGSCSMIREIILDALRRARPYATIASMHYLRREQPMQTRRAA